MTGEEEALYQKLAAMSGGDVVEQAAGEAGGDRELTDAQIEAMIEAMVRDDQQEALYSQLAGLGR